MSFLADVVEVGEKKGNECDFNGIVNGASLEKIWVWVCGRKVKGLKVSLTDGQSKGFGSEKGRHSLFTFTAGEHFSSLSLWETEDENRVCAIKFKTNQSREFFAGAKNNKPEIPVDVASGICLGIKVHSDEGIYRLGFMFINNIKTVELTNVQYPTLYDEIPKVDVKEIKSMSYQNNTSTCQEYKIENSTKIIHTSSWSTSNKLDHTFKLNVMAGIPKLVSCNAGFELKVANERTHTQVNTEEKIEYFSFPVKVPKGKAVDVNITIGQTALNLPFTGTVRVNCYNDGVLEFETKGVYKGVTYTEAKVDVNESCKNLPSPKGTGVAPFEQPQIMEKYKFWARPKKTQ